jgi:hypothetical protein
LVSINRASRRSIYPVAFDPLVLHTGSLPRNKYKSHTLPLRSGFDQLDRRGTTDKEGYLQAGPRLSPRKDNLLKKGGELQADPSLYHLGKQGRFLQAEPGTNITE